MTWKDWPKLMADKMKGPTMSEAKPTEAAKQTCEAVLQSLVNSGVLGIVPANLHRSNIERIIDRETGLAKKEAALRAALADVAHRLTDAQFNGYGDEGPLTKLRDEIYAALTQEHNTMNSTEEVKHAPGPLRCAPLDERLARIARRIQRGVYTRLAGDYANAGNVLFDDNKFAQDIGLPLEQLRQILDIAPRQNANGWTLPRCPLPEELLSARTALKGATP